MFEFNTLLSIQSILSEFMFIYSTIIQVSRDTLFCLNTYISKDLSLTKLEISGTRLGPNVFSHAPMTLTRISSPPAVVIADIPNGAPLYRR